MICAENLSFGYHERELLRSVSFTLEEGCHCTLIGSNGAGKTTLLNLIREHDSALYKGKLTLDSAGRIGFVSQFVPRDEGETATVFDYLSGDFLRLQEKTEELCARMEQEEDLEPLLERYQTLLDESNALDADNYEVNIHQQLRLADLTDKADLPLSALSGGELKLIQVVREMLRRPGLLIMDEPDVFLDFENLAGLRDLINAYRGTLLVVTHSRYLLNHCFDKVWHLENGELQEFDGSFAAYDYVRLQQKIDQQSDADKGEAEIRRVEVLVERLRDEATEVAEAQKGRTLKGKVSYLNRLMKNRIRAPFVELRRPEIRLPEIEAGDGAEAILTVTDYTLSFEDPLLRDVSFTVHRGEKVVLVGPNGTGKTSMLREIRKNGNASVRFAVDARPAFFSQLHAEVLDEGNTIAEEFAALGLTEEETADHLETFCFDRDGLYRRVGQLSGGERNLLQLARLALGDSDLLLLDEPSSHLDTFSQLALEEAISAYKGAVLMVSHDFYTVVNCADTILLVENGTVRPVSGRAFRKMIYKRHFDKDYLELEAKKSDLEKRARLALAGGDTKLAQSLCDHIGELVAQM